MCEEEEGNVNGVINLSASTYSIPTGTTVSRPALQYPDLHYSIPTCTNTPEWHLLKIPAVRYV